MRAGLEISELVSALNDRGPGERSIRRLEAGYSIRLTSVYRVFNLVNARLGGRLNPEREIIEA